MGSIYKKFKNKAFRQGSMIGDVCVDAPGCINLKSGLIVSFKRSFFEHKVPGRQIPSSYTPDEEDRK